MRLALAFYWHHWKNRSSLKCPKNYYKGPSDNAVECWVWCELFDKGQFLSCFQYRLNGIDCFVRVTEGFLEHPEVQAVIDKCYFLPGSSPSWMKHIRIALQRRDCVFETSIVENHKAEEARALTFIITNLKFLRKKEANNRSNCLKIMQNSPEY